MTETLETPAAHLPFVFSSFQLLPNAGGLRDNGRPVRLGSRALELLAALVERHGEVLGSDELIARVWPFTTVDEQNLRVQIAGLRKVLGDGHGDEPFIATVSGRGYRFVAPVSRPSLGGDPHAATVTGNLPPPPSRLFGRAGTISELKGRLKSERMITIVGPGGVGKTSVAVAVAQEAETSQAWFVDLAPVADPSLVPTAILGAFGLAAAPGDFTALLVRTLQTRDALIVLDNCEHLVDRCASLAEALLAAVPALRVLATSREPLRVAGEWALRLPPLESPAEDVPAVVAGDYSAVQLFVHRAAAGGSGFELSSENVDQVTEICRRLDGIPLALELAAATVGALGVNGVAQKLAENVDLPARGRRTAPERQSTLSAMLDWSYRLLTPTEQRALRRLAIFQGGFSLDSAVAVAGPSRRGEPAVLDLLAGLVEKSLVTVDLARDEVRYRLLQTTRSFALGKMDAREVAAAKARHARELRRLAKAIDADWGAQDNAPSRRLSAELIDDLNAATEWALSPLGDIDTAVDLIIDSAGLRRRLSLMQHYRAGIEHALIQVRALSPPNPAAEMRLLGSYELGSAFQVSRLKWLQDAAARMETLARQLDDPQHLIIALWDRFLLALLEGDFETSGAAAESLREALDNSATPSERVLCHHIFSIQAMRVGDLSAALAEVDAGLQLVSSARADQYIVKAGFDPAVYLTELRPRILWVQGHFEQARRSAADCIAECRRRGHAHSLTIVIGNVGAFAGLLDGDLEAAAAAIAEHRQRCEDYGEEGFTAKNQAFLKVVFAVTETGQGDRKAAAMIAPGSDNPAVSVGTPFIGRIAEAVGRSGTPDEGIAAIDVALATSSRHPNDWCRPEMLRARVSTSHGRGRRRGGRGRIAGSPSSRSPPGRPGLGTSYRHQPSGIVVRQRPHG
jgi:predicted ATPase/DNA-binding winged helix-turn-helix (wHTH) protein